MPVKTKRDEEKWQKAKEIAEEAGKGENYAYVMGIYKKMKPDYEFKSGPAAKKAGENEPTDEALWQEALDEAWSRFDVFPSAYASQWAVKWYNDQGGGWCKTAAAKYDHINFKPPAGVASAAKKGLEYRKKQKGDKAGLTPAEAAREGIGSGVQRATNLKNRDTLSPKVVKQMKAFFARHQKNKAVATEHKNEPWKDKGYVSWLLWGGDAGQAWAEKVVGQMEAADKKAKTAAVSPAFLDAEKVFQNISPTDDTWHGKPKKPELQIMYQPDFDPEEMPLPGLTNEVIYKGNVILQRSPYYSEGGVFFESHLLFKRMFEKWGRLAEPALIAVFKKVLKSQKTKLAAEIKKHFQGNPDRLLSHLVPKRNEWEDVHYFKMGNVTFEKNPTFDSRRQAISLTVSFPIELRVDKKPMMSEGPFDRMSDGELNQYIAEFEDQGPENFWQDGELNLSRNQAYAYYRRQWREMSPRDQEAMMKSLDRGYQRYAAIRVASRYFVARSYQDYVEDKERKHEKPMPKKEWESRGKEKDDSSGKGPSKARVKKMVDQLHSMADAVNEADKRFNNSKGWGDTDKEVQKKIQQDFMSVLTRVKLDLKHDLYGDAKPGEKPPKSIEVLDKAWEDIKEVLQKAKSEGKVTKDVLRWVKDHKAVVNHAKGIAKTWGKRTLGDKLTGKKAAERVAARYLGAAQLTARDIEKWLKRQRTWFEITDVDRTGASLDSREYGDVGAERPGRRDYQEAMRLGKLALAEFGADQINVTIEAIDEWINLGGKGQKTPEVWL